ncbi:MAG: FAD-binding oxidoreductase, partial [Chloroflexi bacterium]|nr:FAD-binding oxidoreductase [Chloroflexota bacterium]
MANSSADVVICGAGIAGVAAAYFLSAKAGIHNVVLVDERAPLTLTSDKSTECYRNWWPGPGDAMVRLMDRSIDLMEELARESGNAFNLNRRGYVYATASPQGKASLERASQEIAALGPGPLRVHADLPNDLPYLATTGQGFESPPTGADLLLEEALIAQHFPYITPHASAVLHARRCGWLSAQQLGMYLLEKARARGVQLLRGKVVAVSVSEERVQAVHLQTEAGTSTLTTACFVNAAGPFLKNVGRLLGVELPVFSELHLKMAFDDHLRIVPRDAPMLIWNDPVLLPWSQEERGYLSESEETRWLLEELPSGAHLRPEGGADSTLLLMLWPYHVT